MGVIITEKKGRKNPETRRTVLRRSSARDPYTVYDNDLAVENLTNDIPPEDV